MQSAWTGGEIVFKLDLLNWREFGVASAPSIRSMFEDRPYSGIEKIVRYLEKGHAHLVAAGVGIDALTGKQVMSFYELRDDGDYAWSSMLPYYVKKYNMRLPKEFEEKVLSQ